MVAADRTRIGRRSLLLAGAGTLAALGAAGCGSGAGVPAPTGPRFDLATASDRLIREKPLWYGTLPQSFAFDRVHGHIYVTQAVESDALLPGDREPASTEEGVSGDLCVNKLDLEGNRLEFMRLKGFGHGVGLGVEVVGGSVYVWTETDVNPESGYGRALARTRFTHRAVLTMADEQVAVHNPVPGSTSNQPSIDPHTGRLALRHRRQGQHYYRLFDLADVVRGRYDRPILEVAETDLTDSDEDVFQGFALMGDFVYRLQGTAYTDTLDTDRPPHINPKGSKGNASVSSIDLRTGRVVERVRTEAAWTLDWREPEGIAVDPSGPRLCMGFGGGQGRPWTFTVYTKSTLVPDRSGQPTAAPSGGGRPSGGASPS
ncbi:teichoic acid biosynthesis protein C [Kitasatospora camelliae]|uniref:Teichoic acid biosynthesis protein C n=1 Tax=Kitasatospora camelliae TaxID=3156397 RepID=A0AAU8JZB6_9ACTN